MAEATRSSVLLKMAIALAAIAVLGYLFVHSLETTRSEPYTVERAHLAKWTLVLEPAEGPTSADTARRAWRSPVPSSEAVVRCSSPGIVRERVL